MHAILPNLNNRAQVGLIEFEKIHWLPVNVLFEQCINSLTFNFFSHTGTPYTNNVFKPAGQHNIINRTSFSNLN